MLVVGLTCDGLASHSGGRWGPLHNTYLDVVELRACSVRIIEILVLKVLFFASLIMNRAEDKVHKLAN